MACPESLVGQVKHIIRSSFDVEEMVTIQQQQSQRLSHCMLPMQPSFLFLYIFLLSISHHLCPIFSLFLGGVLLVVLHLVYLFLCVILYIHYLFCPLFNIVLYCFLYFRYCLMKFMLFLLCQFLLAFLLIFLSCSCLLFLIHGSSFCFCFFLVITCIQYLFLFVLLVLLLYSHCFCHSSHVVWQNK